MKLPFKIGKSELLQVSSLNGLSVLLKVLIGLVSAKFTALFLGPSGMALIGNMRNLVSALESVSTLGFQNGIVAELARNSDVANRRKVLSTVVISVLGIAILLGFFFFFFAETVSLYVLQTDAYVEVIQVLGGTLPFFAGSFVLIALLNGLGLSKKVIYTTIAGNVIGLVLVVSLMGLFGVKGALLAAVLSPVLLFFVALWLLSREKTLVLSFSTGHFDSRIFRHLLSFSAMAAFSAIAGPWVFLSLRKFAMDHIGATQAGYWATMEVISNYCLLFIGSLLTVWFFPKLAAAKDKIATRLVILSYYRMVLPFFAFALLLLFFLKNSALRLLFSAEFLPVANLFKWQLSGDFLKACSLILGYNLLAGRHIKMFILTECISYAIMFFFGKFLMLRYGIEGVVMAHLATYVVYLTVLLFYFRKTLFGQVP